MTKHQGNIIFIQNRSQKAGAQTCLWRMLVHAVEHSLWQPVVVTSSPGWLVDVCRAEKIPVLLNPFPRSRSLTGRLYQNGQFARQVAQRLGEEGFQPVLVQGNDHSEGVLSRALANHLHIPAAILLRDPRTRRQDFFKYECNQCQLIATIGTVLQKQVTAWDKHNTIHPIHDGILSREILPPKPLSPLPPRNILVIGSHLPHKGWADMVAAVHLLESQGKHFPLQLDFTGVEPDSTINPLGLERLQTCKSRFLGRINEFQQLIQNYDLVINPSRNETFGMAAIEVLATGVPLISSRSGIIQQVIEDCRYLYPVGDVAALANCLAQVLDNWPKGGLDVPRCQQNCLNHFHVGQTVDFLDQHYHHLLVRPS